MRTITILVFLLAAGCESVQNGLPYTTTELEYYFAASSDSEGFDFGCMPPQWFGFGSVSKSELVELLRDISERYSSEYGEALLDESLVDIINNAATKLFKGHILYRKEVGDVLHDCYYVVYPSLTTNVVDCCGAQFTNCVDYVEIELPSGKSSSVFIKNSLFIDDGMMKMLPMWRRIWFYNTHQRQ